MLWVTGYEIVVSFVKGLRSLYELGTHIHHHRERELVYWVLQCYPRWASSSTSQEFWVQYSVWLWTLAPFPPAEVKRPVVRVTKQPRSQVVPKRGEFRLTCRAVSTEDEPLQYQWYHSGSMLTGSTQETLVRWVALGFYKVVPLSNTTVYTVNFILKLAWECGWIEPVWASWCT